MIRRERGELIAECDNCGESSDCYFRGGDDWHEFIAELKEKGWRIRKDDDEWKHYCPDCVAEAVDA